jgi:hypothetical protein
MACVIRPDFQRDPYFKDAEMAAPAQVFGKRGPFPANFGSIRTQEANLGVSGAEPGRLYTCTVQPRFVCSGRDSKRGYGAVQEEQTVSAANIPLEGVWWQAEKQGGPGACAERANASDATCMMGAMVQAVRDPCRVWMP